MVEVEVSPRSLELWTVDVQERVEPYRGSAGVRKDFPKCVVRLKQNAASGPPSHFNLQRVITAVRKVRDQIGHCGIRVRRKAYPCLARSAEDLGEYMVDERQLPNLAPLHQ